ncbi:hypothetical protein MBLNU230_g1801t1 [Neophaeotheca triangularis]
MPAKLDDPTSLRFLYCCMCHSNYSSIDYNAVGHAFSIKAPAARMRFTRLREALDPDLLKQKKLPGAEGERSSFKRNHKGEEKGKVAKGKTAAKEGFEGGGGKRGDFWAGWDADDEEEDVDYGRAAVKKEEEEEGEEDFADEGQVMKRLKSWAEGLSGPSQGDEDAKFVPVDRFASVGLEAALEAGDQKAQTPHAVTVDYGEAVEHGDAKNDATAIYDCDAFTAPTTPPAKGLEFRTKKFRTEEPSEATRPFETVSPLVNFGLFSPPATPERGGGFGDHVRHHAYGEFRSKARDEVAEEEEAVADDARNGEAMDEK